ncbi:MAG: GNAT family N-acetyltransferase [Paludibacter sp.]|nr:GNAT family N-acetyltransferase [Paludibacter sp.]
MTDLKIRRIKASEIKFLEDMLYEAIYIPEGESRLPRSIIKDPSLAKYIENWGKNNSDIALVAETNEKLIGAIWVRQFSETNKGYGYIDETIPEMGMAIYSEYRNKGIGKRFIREMKLTLQENDFKAVSLSVDKANYAFKFYKREGFETISETETSATMIKYI